MQATGRISPRPFVVVVQQAWDWLGEQVPCAGGGGAPVPPGAASATGFGAGAAATMAAKAKVMMDRNCILGVWDWLVGGFWKD